MSLPEKRIFVCSDAVGETAEAVVRATIRQFAGGDFKVKRYGKLSREEEVKAIVAEAAESRGVIAYTLVQPELRDAMREEAIRLGVRAVDVMGPMMQAFIDTFNDSPVYKPGLLHELDEQYFRRIEAVEFAVKYDDGKDARGLLQAQVVLIGVSRTSKTPLSIYLAHKGIKTANYPLTPEIKPPNELFAADGRLIIGLTMDPERLLKVRTERLKSLGLPARAAYASLDRIKQELAYADEIMKRLRCPVIDVTEKSIEETAGIILNYLQG
jgi:hypothetical protein